MSHVLIIGGGLAGCTAAKELSENGVSVTIVETAGRIGGKVREYGCKATDVCNNCGVCLTAGLWDKVEHAANIEILKNSKLIDLTGEKGSFTAAVKQDSNIKYIKDISNVIVATGFEETVIKGFNGFAELSGKDRVITGSELEQLLTERTEKSVSENAAAPPESVAFIQCYGSRDSKENGVYCSKVCCAYSTRAAKVLKHYYPECKITFYYMELQNVKSGNYYEELTALGMEFIKCRPVEIDGKNGLITFDNHPAGKREQRQHEVIILTDGIRPAADSGRLAEICGLTQDSTGFLKYTTGPAEAKQTGIYLAGCAAGPKKIETAHAEALAAAREIIQA